jgi:hypothetical protein
MTVKLSRIGATANKKSWLVGLLMLAIAASAALGGLAVMVAAPEEGNTDAAGVRAYVDSPPDDHYNALSGDYSGSTTRWAAALVREEVWPLGELDVGVATNDLSESSQSDDIPFVVRSEQQSRQADARPPDSLVIHAGELSGSNISDIAYEDGESIRVNGSCGLDEAGEIYQEYRLRGAAMLDYLEQGWLRDLYPTVDEFAEESNFRSGGHYPAFLEELNLEITFKLADYFSADPDPDAALPLRYYIKFYNHHADKWDTYRSETLDSTPGLEVYARGIYQTDYLALTDENFQFGAYFDTADGLSLRARIGVTFTYGRGGRELLSVDRLAYSFASQSEAIRLDCSGAIDPGLPESEWESDPTPVLEVQAPGFSGAGFSVIRTTTPDGRGRCDGIPLPEEEYDVGVELPDGAEGMYEPSTGTPNFDVCIYAEEELELEIDSLLITYPHIDQAECPSRWHSNATVEGASAELLWEINLTATRTVVNATLDLPEGFEASAVLTPYGQDCLPEMPAGAREEGGNITVTEQLAALYGRGTYQVQASSLNYLEGAALTDDSGSPINETDYSEPLRHEAALRDYGELEMSGELGSAEATFTVENMGYTYYANTTEMSPDPSVPGFSAETNFTASAVGMVECRWVWDNGKQLGFWPSAFVLRGCSEDAPFIKVFTPEWEERVREDALLYVAVIASSPEDVGYSVGDQPSYTEMEKGFLEEYEGAPGVLRDYTFFSTLPVGDLPHNSRELVDIRGKDGSNGKTSEETVAVNIDKEAVLEIDRVDQAFDDRPTRVNYTADTDIVLVSVYLDGERIGTFEGSDIGGSFMIPKLRSGTYFLEVRAQDAVGNVNHDTASFFVNQRNPTLLGTLSQWIRDFFKIFGVAVLSLLSSLGVLAYVRKIYKGKSRECPAGSSLVEKKCEVIKDEHI